MAPLQIPPDVIAWFRTAFAVCNERITNKLSTIPNVHEESLDMTFIEHLSQYEAPVSLPSGWTVKVDTHFLGGLRHFVNRWEIADIGLIVQYRHNGKFIRSKAAVLQSKRLYPTVGTVREDMEIDYRTGFARLADAEAAKVPLYVGANFEFDTSSKYAALLAHDEQYKAIESYTKTAKIPVFYQLYNPRVLPWTQRFPRSTTPALDHDVQVGVRILPANEIFATLARKAPNYAPTYADFLARASSGEIGWRLEHFVADRLIACKEGYVFTDLREAPIEALFNRRSGPIAAAVSFAIELPEGMG